MKTLSQTKKTPVTKRTIAEEYRLAKHEKRQPLCVFCGEELLLSQTRYTGVALVWDGKHGRFVEGERDYGGLDMPACTHCDKENWGVVDEKTYSR